MSHELENSEWVKETAKSQTNRVDLLNTHEELEALEVVIVDVLNVLIVLEDYLNILCDTYHEHGTQVK